MPSDAVLTIAEADVPPATIEISTDTPRMEIMGLTLHDLHRDRIADVVFAASLARRKTLVVNANAHLVVLSQKETWLRAMFSAADIAFCDGAGVQLAAMVLRGRNPHRTTPPEWLGTVVRRLGADGSIFWLGGTAATAHAAAARFERIYGVRVAGVQDGYFDAARNSPDSLAVIRAINEARPSLLLVSMSMPRQERWLWDHWDQLDPGVAVTTGAFVDHAAGRVHRPPRWVANLGIEWLVRLVREPRRLWRRYILGLPLFGLYVARYGAVHLLGR